MSGRELGLLVGWLGLALLCGCGGSNATSDGGGTGGSAAGGAASGATTGNGGSLNGGAGIGGAAGAPGSGGEAGAGGMAGASGSAGAGGAGSFSCAGAQLDGDCSTYPLGLVCAIPGGDGAAYCTCLKGTGGTRWSCDGSSPCPDSIGFNPGPCSASTAGAISTFGGCKYPVAEVCFCQVIAASRRSGVAPISEKAHAPIGNFRGRCCRPSVYDTEPALRRVVPNAGERKGLSIRLKRARRVGARARGYCASFTNLPLSATPDTKLPAPQRYSVSLSKGSFL